TQYAPESRTAFAKFRRAVVGSDPDAWARMGRRRRTRRTLRRPRRTPAHTLSRSEAQRSPSRPSWMKWGVPFGFKFGEEKASSWAEENGMLSPFPSREPELVKRPPQHLDEARDVTWQLPTCKCDDADSPFHHGI